MLNGKVICTKGCTDVMIKNKIYPFYNGRFIREDGKESNFVYKSIEDFNNRNGGIKINEVIIEKQTPYEHLLEYYDLEEGDEFELYYKSNDKKISSLSYNVLSDKILYNNKVLLSNKTLMDLLNDNYTLKLVENKKQKEIEKIEKEMRQLADRIAELKKESD